VHNGFVEAEVKVDLWVWSRLRTSGHDLSYDEEEDTCDPRSGPV
jgi:hypothetical protein